MSSFWLRGVLASMLSLGVGTPSFAFTITPESFSIVSPESPLGFQFSGVGNEGHILSEDGILLSNGTFIEGSFRHVRAVSPAGIVLALDTDDRWRGFNGTEEIFFAGGFSPIAVDDETIIGTTTGGSRIVTLDQATGSITPTPNSPIFDDFGLVPMAVNGTQYIGFGSGGLLTFFDEEAKTELVGFSHVIVGTEVVLDAFSRTNVDDGVVWSQDFFARVDDGRECSAAGTTFSGAYSSGVYGYSGGNGVIYDYDCSLFATIEGPGGQIYDFWVNEDGEYAAAFEGSLGIFEGQDDRIAGADFVPTDVAPIPLPAPLFFLLSGLGLLGLLRAPRVS